MSQLFSAQASQRIDQSVCFGCAPTGASIKALLRGAGVREGAMLPQVRMVDVAPTVVVLLGLNSRRRRGRLFPDFWPNHFRNSEDHRLEGARPWGRVSSVICLGRTLPGTVPGRVRYQVMLLRSPMLAHQLGCPVSNGTRATCSGITEIITYIVNILGSGFL